MKSSSKKQLTDYAGIFAKVYWVQLDKVNCLLKWRPTSAASYTTVNLGLRIPVKVQLCIHPSLNTVFSVS